MPVMSNTWWEFLMFWRELGEVYSHDHCRDNGGHCSCNDRWHCCFCGFG